MAIALDVFRNGAVGFIDWLDATVFYVPSCRRFVLRPSQSIDRQPVTNRTLSVIETMTAAVPKAWDWTPSKLCEPWSCGSLLWL